MAFDLYDTSGDGLLSYSEMVQYLNSVFTLAMQNPDASHIKLTPKELAEKTTKVAFKMFGLDFEKDDLTFEQFRKWYQKADPS